MTSSPCASARWNTSSWSWLVCCADVFCTCAISVPVVVLLQTGIRRDSRRKADVLAGGVYAALRSELHGDDRVGLVHTARQDL